MLTLDQLGISEEDWNQTPASVRVALMFLLQQNQRLENRYATYEIQVQRLEAELQRLKKLELEVAELRERLGQNSQNSSKPPSSDPPSVSRPNNRQPSGRQRDGQVGHQGRTRKHLPPEEVRTVIELRPTTCRQCGGLLLGDDPDPVCHQVSEIPPVKAEVTEYQQHRLSCQVCGAVTEAEWPEEMPSGNYGLSLGLGSVFEAIKQRGGTSAEIGAGLLEEVRELFDLWRQLRAGSLSREQFQQQMEPIQAQVRELVERGASCEQTKTRRTCANLLNHEVSLWTFVREEGVEPTNNNAERPLRRAVMWRRKSFGTQSESGSRFVERILTVVTSLRQQGRDVLKYLTSACVSDGRERLDLPDSRFWMILSLLTE